MGNNHVQTTVAVQRDRLHSLNCEPLASGVLPAACIVAWPVSLGWAQEEELKFPADADQ